MDGAAPRQALYVRLGEHTLALGDGLRQVVTVSSLTRIPRVGPELLGLFSVRGEVLPLIDLRPLFGETPAAGVGAAGRPAALLEHGGRRVALALDEVLGFFPVRESAAAAIPALAPFTRMNTTYDGLSASVLDLGRLMAALERGLVVL